GNDYWVWERVTVVNPIVVIVEFNSVFGSKYALTIPYDPTFARTRAHFSNLYFGASIAAFVNLAKAKGYAFVGCNTAGNNAYFVREDKLGRIPSRSAADGYVVSKFREARDVQGRLEFLSGGQRLARIGHLPVVDLVTGHTSLINLLPGFAIGP
ncbi:MAG: hypothetical protein JWM85_1514, partial [Acidimicrobiaceae bacterium]|nr:hypothetical protein [Acidimicrobiaceae bacterium]